MTKKISAVMLILVLIFTTACDPFALGGGLPGGLSTAKDFFNKTDSQQALFVTYGELVNGNIYEKDAIFYWGQDADTQKPALFIKTAEDDAQLTSAWLTTGDAGQPYLELNVKYDDLNGNSVGVHFTLLAYGNEITGGTWELKDKDW